MILLSPDHFPHDDESSLGAIVAETYILQIKACDAPLISQAASARTALLLNDSMDSYDRSKLDQLDVLGTRTFRPLTLSVGYLLAFA